GLSGRGGLATGVAWLTSEIFAKRLDLVRGLVPQARAIGVLVNPKSPEVAPQLAEIEAAARTLGRPLRIGEASTDAQFAPAFAGLVAGGGDALGVSNDAFFNGRPERVIALAGP